jgi:hypothetical protein
MAGDVGSWHNSDLWRCPTFSPQIAPKRMFSPIAIMSTRANLLHADYLTRRSNSAGTGVENERQPREAGSGAHELPVKAVVLGKRRGSYVMVAPSLYRALYLACTYRNPPSALTTEILSFRYGSPSGDCDCRDHHLYQSSD